METAGGEGVTTSREAERFACAISLIFWGALAFLVHIAGICSILCCY